MNIQADEVVEIVEKFMPLILSTIKNYANYPHLYEDLIEDGIEETIVSLKEYDKDSGVNLAWFLKVRLRTYYRNKQKYERRRMHGDITKTPSGYDPYLDEENRLYLEAILKNLDESLLEIIKLHYFSDYSIKEIAQIKHLSENQVYYLKNKALKILKQVAL